MTFQTPEFIPVSVGLLGAAWIRHREALTDLVVRHPAIFGEPKEGARDYDAATGLYVEGDHVDEWGCVWRNVRRGMDAMVAHHPVPTREAVRTLKPPQNDVPVWHGFMFLRLVYLRGYEEAMVDFAEEPPELQRLIDIVLEYNMRQLRLKLEGRTEPNVLYFGDDLGMQNSLPISPAKWRKFLKPCFARIYGACRDAGHWVYMHSDGHIIEIIPDLIECGVNVINPQVGANGLENLTRLCKGKVCVDLDLDRQHFPFWTPADIDRHVRDAVEALGSPEGGLWLKAECGPDVPIENIEAVCQALEKYRGYYRSAG